MMYPLVGDLAGEGIPVAVSCRVLGFSKQAFYAWRKNPVSRRDFDDAQLINAAYDVHADDPEFGYRLIADELVLEKGFAASENRVQRLCALEGIASSIVRRRGSGKKVGPAVHDDHVNRDFTADAVNLKWLVDITEHPTAEGKLYLCAIKDCASNRIVGYALGSRMTSQLAVTALRMAIILRGRPAGTIVHSDRGGQFRSKKFAMMLRNNQLVGSMGRVSSAADNAAMESFFALLQTNVLNRGPWASRRELRLAIVHWIERTYHRRRRQRTLGKLTPIEFETIYNQTALAA
jgi:putative transposase